MIVVIDYDMGNVGSIMNMLSKLGAKAVLWVSTDDVVAADKQ
jgi:imidazoleglycerol phosphate synthase glutamine amidotransferase subunit HisH